MEIGKVLHENSDPRENKREVSIEGVKIDFVDGKGCIHEIKKSRSLEEAHVWQVKYYLYLLHQRGVENVEAYLDYPLLRKKEEVKLMEEDFPKIEEHLQQIQTLLIQPKSPKMKVMKICKKCAYQEFCWG